MFKQIGHLCDNGSPDIMQFLERMALTIVSHIILAYYTQNIVIVFGINGDTYRRQMLSLVWATQLFVGLRVSNMTSAHLVCVDRNTE